MKFPQFKKRGKLITLVFVNGVSQTQRASDKQQAVDSYASINIDQEASGETGDISLPNANTDVTAVAMRFIFLDSQFLQPSSETLHNRSLLIALSKGK